MLPESHFYVGIHAPAGDCREHLILLVRAVSTKTNRERKMLVPGPIKSDATGDRRRARGFPRGGIAALEHRDFLSERIQQTSLEDQRGRLTKIPSVRNLYGWRPHPQIARP